MSESCTFFVYTLFASISFSLPREFTSKRLILPELSFVLCDPVTAQPRVLETKSKEVLNNSTENQGKGDILLKYSAGVHQI